MNKTKISATIGCDLDDPERLIAIIDAGADMIRVPFWNKYTDKIIKNLKRVREYNKRPEKIEFLIDTKTEKVRFGDFDTNPKILYPNMTYRIIEGKISSDKYVLPVDKHGIIEYIFPGEMLVCGDGEAVLKVIDKDEKCIYARPITQSALPSRKGLAVTGKNIIQKDPRQLEEVIDFSAENDIDWLAISFTEQASEISSLRKKFKGRRNVPALMGKIESPLGVQNMQEIVEESDGIMIARGDLPNHADYGMMGIYQKRILDLCHKYRKIGMVSTGVMMSAISRPRPQPAEIIDITYAVLQGADYIQMCEETAFDQSNRINIIRMARHIIDSVENYKS